MARKPIDGKESVKDLLIKMSEGNPGAAKVLTEMLQADFTKGIIRVLDLDDMNIRGPQIWVGYKDHCGMEIDTFMDAVKRRDEEMVKTINDECLFDGFTEIAVINRFDERILSNKESVISKDL